MSDDFDTTEWITTTEAAELTGYAAAYFRQLIKRGRLQAQKRGRDWFLNKMEVLTYAEEMQRIGPQKYDPWRTKARHQDDGAE